MWHMDDCRQNYKWYSLMVLKVFPTKLTVPVKEVP